jgi:hypothetical protein
LLTLSSSPVVCQPKPSASLRHQIPAAHPPRPHRVHFTPGDLSCPGHTADLPPRSLESWAFPAQPGPALGP